MPKASPSKAPLPKKPREPKKVKDVALNTMRVANYKAKMAVYEEEMAAYKVGQRRREADKVAVKRRLSASDADPAAPAAKRPTPARRETPEACAAGSAEAARAPPADTARAGKRRGASRSAATAMWPRWPRTSSIKHFLSPPPSGDEALEIVGNLITLLLPGSGSGRSRIPFHVSAARVEQA